MPIEHATNGMLERVRLVSIKGKIIVFAIVATLVPAFTMGWLSYRNNRNALDEKVEIGLSGLTAHASRELKLWLGERRQETRVLAGSYEVSENAELLLRGPTGPVADASRERLGDYLRRVSGRFPDVESLIVVGLDGTELARTGAAELPELPEAWPDELRAGRPVVGLSSGTDDDRRGALTVVEPIRNIAGAMIGAMVARLELDALDPLLGGTTGRDGHRLYVADEQGRVLATAVGLSRETARAHRLPGASVAAVLGAPQTVNTYGSFTGEAAVGMSRRVPDIGWFVVAERDEADAYAAVHRLRDQTLSLIVVVALVVGLLAYLLGVTIVRPLDRLIGGARRVARSDFDVELPVYGHHEVAYLTKVFNRMTASLRASHAASTALQDALRERNTKLLEEALTDPLTGLFNRKSFRRILDREVAAARRHDRVVSVLMIDVDHFKRFNDEFGHLAGDDALRAVADRIRETARTCDYAMRYGGEEFLLLTENDTDGAMQLGERLRGQIEALDLDDAGRISVSIGVATFGTHAHDPDELIEQADAALYAAKAEGRNRVNVADERELPPVPTPDPETAAV